MGNIGRIGVIGQFFLTAEGAGSGNKLRVMLTDLMNLFSRDDRLYETLPVGPTIGR